MTAERQNVFKDLVVTEDFLSLMECKGLKFVYILNIGLGLVVFAFFFFISAARFVLDCFLITIL